MFKRNESFRLPIDPPISGNFRFIKIDGQPIESQSAGVLDILDVSPSGLKVKMSYKIDLKKAIELQVTFVLNESPIVVEGELVWQKHFIDTYTYGVKVLHESRTQQELLDEIKKYVQKK